MNFSTLLKVFDTVASVLDVRKEGSNEPKPTGPPQTPAPTFADLVETRLTNVVVAALKEAFDRDHARLELERAHLDEQRRHAEETMRMELRRQAMDREIGRLRLLAGAGLVGWIASVLLLGARLQGLSGPSRGLLIAGCVLLLGSLGSAFTAQGIIGANVHEDDPLKTAAGTAALWLLITGLALTAVSLLL